MCHTLLANYLQDVKENKDKINDVISIEENEFIFNFMEKLFEYLNENILTYPRIQQILSNASTSKHNR